MSWLFSQALVAEFSADTSLAGELSVPSSSSPMQRAFLSHGKTTEFSRLSRFGMMCAPLTDAHGTALLTSFLAASRARTSARPGVAQVLPGGVEVACGAKWRASSVRYDPASSSWKTAHCLWEEDLPSSSVILPKWGSMQRGAVFQHPTAERPISGIVSGLWATPSATDGNRGGTLTENMTGISLVQQINTPSRWPTPTVCGNYNRKGISASIGDGLATAVAKYPTPTASAAKGWAPNHNRADSDDRLDYTIERSAFQTGQKTPPKRLNPAWVEWLMGWPPGFTDLKPLAMDKFREWQQQHSPF